MGDVKKRIELAWVDDGFEALTNLYASVRLGMKSEGIDIVCIPSFDEAYAKINALMPDCVLMDLHEQRGRDEQAVFDHTRGIKEIERLAEGPFTFAIPVIVLTIHPPSSDIGNLAMEAGASIVVNKGDLGEDHARLTCEVKKQVAKAGRGS